MGITHLAHINGALAGDCHFDIYDPSWYFKFASYFQLRNNIQFVRSIPNVKYDGVIITSPPHFHSSNFQDTLDLSDKFFIEKPLMLSEKDVLSAHSSNKSLYCGYVLRKNPCVQFLETLLDGSAPDEVEVNVLSNLGQDQTEDWRFDLHKGGGCINELGSHAINLALKFSTLSNGNSVVKQVNHLDVGTFSLDVNSESNVSVSGNWNTNVRKTMYKLTVRNNKLNLTTDLQYITGEIQGQAFNWSPRQETLPVCFYIRGIDFALQNQDWLEGKIFESDIIDAITTDNILREVLKNA